MTFEQVKVGNLMIYRREKPSKLFVVGYIIHIEHNQTQMNPWYSVHVRWFPMQTNVVFEDWSSRWDRVVNEYDIIPCKKHDSR